MKPHIFPQLDGLRALAALGVLFHHYWPNVFHWDPTGGRLGADLFFVLSGFLITRTLLKAREITGGDWRAALKDFYIRRALRIIPLCYLTLFLVTVLRWDHFGSGLGWHLGFLSNYYFIHHGAFVGASGHLWTLSVEQHFYLVWPLILLFTPMRHVRAATLALIGMGIVFRIIAQLYGWSNITIDIMTPGAFETLGTGALLATLQRMNPDIHWRTDRRIGALGGFGLGLLLLRAFWPENSITASWLGLVTTELSRALLLGWILAQAVAGIPGFPGRLLACAPLRWIGQASFGIYLSHNFFLVGLGTPSGTWQALFALAATLAWALLCYVALERPFFIRRSAL